MLIVGLWNTFNLIMAGVALGAVSERKQPDRHPRLTIKRNGWLDFSEQRVAVEIVNVSAGGCAVRLLEEMPPMLLEAEDTRARLTIEPIGDLVGSRSLPLIFRRSPIGGGDDLFGCEFDTMQPEEYYVLADLMYGDSDALPRFLMSRRKHKSIWAGTGQFIWWGIIEPVRAVSYLFKSKPSEEQELQAEPAPATSTAWLKRLVAQAGEKGDGKAGAETMPARKSA